MTADLHDSDLVIVAAYYAWAGGPVQQLDPPQEARFVAYTSPERNVAEVQFAAVRGTWTCPAGQITLIERAPTGMG